MYTSELHVHVQTQIPLLPAPHTHPHPPPTNKGGKTHTTDKSKKNKQRKRGGSETERPPHIMDTLFCCFNTSTPVPLNDKCKLGELQLDASYVSPGAWAPTSHTLDPLLRAWLHVNTLLRKGIRQPTQAAA
jgi:hypothetical protein